MSNYIEPHQEVIRSAKCPSACFCGTTIWTKLFTELNVPVELRKESTARIQFVLVDDTQFAEDKKAEMSQSSDFHFCNNGFLAPKPADLTVLS